MAHHVIEWSQQCKACDGTGLYVGMAERDGCAVVCARCNGSGQSHHRFEYDEFVGRLPRDGIVRVIEANPGIMVGVGDKRLTLEAFGGLSIEDWHAGKPFGHGTEMRTFTCPCWWFQSTSQHTKPRWDECEWGTFSRCSHFKTKADCWRRWDAELQEAE